MLLLVVLQVNQGWVAEDTGVASVVIGDSWSGKRTGLITTIDPTATFLVSTGGVTGTSIVTLGINGSGISRSRLVWVPRTSCLGRRREGGLSHRYHRGDPYGLAKHFV